MSFELDETGVGYRKRDGKGSEYAPGTIGEGLNELQDGMQRYGRFTWNFLKGASLISLLGAASSTVASVDAALNDLELGPAFGYGLASIVGIACGHMLYKGAEAIKKRVSDLNKTKDDIEEKMTYGRMGLDDISRTPPEILVLRPCPKDGAIVTDNR